MSRTRDKCVANGWGPGTLLVGDEGYGSSVIEIISIDNPCGDSIAARRIAHNGKPVADRTTWWILEFRDWREATADDLPSDDREAS